MKKIPPMIKFDLQHLELLYEYLSLFPDSTSVLAPTSMRAKDGIGGRFSTNSPGRKQTVKKLACLPACLRYDVIYSYARLFEGLLELVISNTEYNTAVRIRPARPFFVTRVVRRPNSLP